MGLAEPENGLRPQPAYGEHTEQPEIEAQNERADEECARDDFARWTDWPVLVLLALVEVAWLVALVYLIHRFVLS